MNFYVMDTDILTLYQENDTHVIQHMLLHSADRLAVTVINVEEQLSGWYTLLRQSKRLDQLELAYDAMTRSTTSYRHFEILSYPNAAMQRYQHLRSQKLNVGKYDLRIASIALEFNATVVTRNLRDFTRVPGLSVVDWSL